MPSHSSRFSRFCSLIRPRPAAAPSPKSPKQALARFLWESPLSLLLCAALLVSGAVVLRQSAALPVFSGQPDEPYRTGITTTGRIAIACNVAWGQETLPEMLQTLEEAGVTITFNILGEWADSHPDDLRRIAEAGHELGLHGYYHKNYSALSAAQVQEDISRADETVFRIVGMHTTLFTPPSGDYDEESLRAAQELGMVVYLWSIDTIDWRREGAEATLRRVFRDPKAGDIILMHPLPDTAKTLPEILSGLHERGLTVCPVGELLPDSPLD